MKISPSELPLLKALWSKGELSAREIHEQVSVSKSWSFSTTRKTLERMVGKDMVAMKEFHGVRVYTAQVEKVSTLASMTRDFISRVLEVKGPLPGSMFTGSEILEPDEIKELEKLMKDFDESEQS